MTLRMDRAWQPDGQTARHGGRCRIERVPANPTPDPHQPSVQPILRADRRHPEIACKAFSLSEIGVKGHGHRTLGAGGRRARREGHAYANLSVWLDRSKGPVELRGDQIAGRNAAAKAPERHHGACVNVALRVLIAPVDAATDEP